jgi:protein-disulfide isomerase
MERMMIFKILLAALAISPSLFADSASAKQGLLAPDLMDKSEWKAKLQMGNAASDNETYIVTDWLCPGCKMKEPELEQMIPKILQNSRVYFIDLANHPGSADFVQYNLSFLLNNKDIYLNLRPILNKFSQSGQAPSEAQINEELSPFHVKHIPLSSNQINAISNYFRSVTSSLNVTGTPTLVLKNGKTKKIKSLSGNAINEQNVIKTLEEIEKP